MRVSPFRPLRITAAELAQTPIVEGQLIFTVDTHALFVDVSDSERVEVEGKRPTIFFGSEPPASGVKDGDIFIKL
jgi:hypothetical protein